MKKQSSDSSLSLGIDDISTSSEDKKKPLISLKSNNKGGNRSRSSSTCSSDESSELSRVNTKESFASNVEKKGKRIIKRARAIPITKTQKRARWAPGHRYMPLLILQWMWHPISTLIQARKSAHERDHVNDRKLHSSSHDHHHHHHYHADPNAGQSASTSVPQNIFGDSGGDLFIE